ncbi:hypothetical protein [Cellulomonas carbonis]|uniref:Uncharacterized protein n=1 Tax=Cellulomonas carbonis T26 TaxID=947969 RepID=A0A0A0BWI3_9CELL|nr:hypothetical protein [Cellulomonas carbonis]KGM11544.1 hypothetical protein N868_17205 [Cellulomonas carbonis T26]
MTSRPRPRRSTLLGASAVACAVALVACTPGGGDDPDASSSADTSERSGGDGGDGGGAGGDGGPVVVGGHEYEPILEGTFPVPGTAGDDATTVGLVSLVGSGDTTELRLVLTPQFSSADEGISIYEMLDDHVAPEIWDVAGLRSYDVVSDTGIELETDVVAAQTANGEPVLYQGFFPALEGRPEAVDVVVHPAWPVFEDVPVTYED